MVWVGSFKSLETMLCRPRLLNAPLEVHTWVPTSIALISRLVDWLMRLIAGSRCVEGTEHFVALALQVFESNYRLSPPRKSTKCIDSYRIGCGGRGCKPTYGRDWRTSSPTAELRALAVSHGF